MHAQNVEWKVESASVDDVSVSRYDSSPCQRLCTEEDEITVAQESNLKGEEKSHQFSQTLNKKKSSPA